MGSPITVVGAGPAGLAAAIAIARRGVEVVVHERRKQVGARFHGDFQGLENWSTEGDVLEELGSFGIEPEFQHNPFRELVVFSPGGKEFVYKSSQPLWYLVRRGTDPGTLDQSLAMQAQAAGVDIKLGSQIKTLPDGGIVAHGPTRADAIAVGYTFETDMADAAYVAVSDDLAPDGYAYLLVSGGRGTLASCMFSNFHEEKLYLERSVEFFRTRVGISWRNEKRFGGFGNMKITPELQRGRMLLAGEASGLQDFLFGFGMRYAMVSGNSAGVAFANGDLASYSQQLRQRLQPLVKAGAVNRFLYGLAGNRGYSKLIGRVAASEDPRDWARRYYRGRWWTPFIYPLAVAQSRFAHRRDPVEACLDDCDCTWCRCARTPAGTSSSNDLGNLDRPEFYGDPFS